MRADFSVEEVKEAKGRAVSEPKDYPVSFARMSFWERGHFDIKTRFRHRRYSMKDVLGVDLLLETKSKGYGAGASISYTRRTLVIKVSGKSFKVDVSGQNADFRNSNRFEDIMCELFDVKKIDKRK